MAWKFHRTGRLAEIWPVLLLLLVVAAPTIGVLWFVSVAMENQQLATRQRLAEAYRSNLQHVQQQLQDRWQSLVGHIDSMRSNTPNQTTFARVAAGNSVDSIILYDQQGQVRYPTWQTAEVFLPRIDPLWEQADALEYTQRAWWSASDTYGAIAQAATDELEMLAAMQAQVRCLLQLHPDQTAQDRVIQIVDDSRLSRMQSAGAQSILANLELAAVRQGTPGAARDRIERRLAARVQDYYGTGALGSAQRLFLVHELRNLGKLPSLPRELLAEQLAADYLGLNPARPSLATLQPSPLEGIWHCSTPTGTTTVLMATESVERLIHEAAAGCLLPDDVMVSVIAPFLPTPTDSIVAEPAGDFAPGWRVCMSIRDSRQIDAMAVQRNRLHRWTSILVVSSTSALGLIITLAFHRRLHLAKLKSDLVGTVSHELKTPLSSMRLLVDTLLDDEQLNPRTTREYLQLIAQENSRLSRLIENFLTFSRMDRGKCHFEFHQIEAAAIVHHALEAMGERLRQADCLLTVDLAQDVPPIRADMEALVTVLINLLDNAYKYSRPIRKIAIGVRCDASRQYVRLSVSDNGIGLPRGATRRIFQRFYQADQRLARTGQGCGLGLSIVRDIVHAHQGKVSVSSRLGEGSTFEVIIPAIVERDLAKAESNIDV